MTTISTTNGALPHIIPGAPIARAAVSSTPKPVSSPTQAVINDVDPKTSNVFGSTAGFVTAYNDRLRGIGELKTKMETMTGSDFEKDVAGRIGWDAVRKGKADIASNLKDMEGVTQAWQQRGSQLFGNQVAFARDGTASLTPASGDSSARGENFRSPTDFIQSYNLRMGALNQMKPDHVARSSNDNTNSARAALNASTRYSNDAMQTLRQRGNELFGNQFSYNKDGMASLMTKAVVPLNQLT